MLDYAEHALSSGGDAQAAAYVECEVDGATRLGRRHRRQHRHRLAQGGHQRRQPRPLSSTRRATRAVAGGHRVASPPTADELGTDDVRAIGRTPHTLRRCLRVPCWVSIVALTAATRGRLRARPAATGADRRRRPADRRRGRRLTPRPSSSKLTRRQGRLDARLQPGEVPALARHRAELRRPRHGAQAGRHQGQAVRLQRGRRHLDQRLRRHARSTDPTKVDIDHMVPLANAWRSGAVDWTDDEARGLRQRPRPAAAVRGVADLATGPRATRTRPRGSRRRPATWCEYAQDWIAVKTLLETDGDRRRRRPR